MNKLDLAAIIRRLRAMKYDKSSFQQIRRFELFGIELCQVEYNQIQDEYKVTEYRQNRVFTFDDMDLAAIEVYDTMKDLQLTF